MFKEHAFFFFTDQNSKRIVMALQSGLKSELTWALNSLTLLSFKEKDDVRKDATPLAKLPGVLDALLQVVCTITCKNFNKLGWLRSQQIVHFLVCHIRILLKILLICQ